MTKDKQRLKDWIDVRRRHRLSDAQVQMARELGLNPRNLGERDDHRHESWKLPLPEWIEGRYLERFGKKLPDVVTSIEERARLVKAKKARKRAEKVAKPKKSPCLPNS